MSVIVVIELKAKAGSRARLVAQFADILGDTRAFAGCQSVELIADAERPEWLTLLERWDNVEAYQRYKAWRIQSGTSVVAGPHVDGPPQVRFYTILDPPPG